MLNEILNYGIKFITDGTTDPLIKILALFGALSLFLAAVSKGEVVLLLGVYVFSFFKWSYKKLYKKKEVGNHGQRN